MSITKETASFIVLILTAVLLTCATGWAEDQLFTYEDKTFTAKLFKDKEGKKDILKLRVLKSDHKKSTVFSIPDPSRIVIDLLGAKVRRNKDFALASAPFVKAVRFGSHADKVRIVIDLKDNKTIPYKLSEASGQLTLTIESQTDSKETKTVVEPTPVKAEVEPSPLPKPTAVPEPTKAHITVESKSPSIVKAEPESETVVEESEVDEVIESLNKGNTKETTAKTKPDKEISKVIEQEESVHKEEKTVNAKKDKEELIEELIGKEPVVKVTVPAKTSTPQATKTKTPAPTPTEVAVPTETPAELQTAVATVQTTQSVRAINFGYNDNVKSNPVIKIDVVNKTQFELQKTEDKVYTLTIKDCREMKPELRLVNFPPHDFVGFTFVQAEPDKTDIVVKIGVERNKRIIATPNENQIWVTLQQEEKLETKSPPSGKKPGAPLK